jgi:hypothetical protein
VPVAYECIFAALFEWNLARWSGDKKMASSLTAFGLGLLITMNYLAILGWIALRYGPITAVPHVVLGMLSVAPMAINYAAFLRQNRYVEVVHRFNRRTNAVQRRSRIAAATYVALTFLVHLVLIVALFNR